MENMPKAVMKVFSQRRSQEGSKTSIEYFEGANVLLFVRPRVVVTLIAPCVEVGELVGVTDGICEEVILHIVVSCLRAWRWLLMR